MAWRKDNPNKNKRNQLILAVLLILVLSVVFFAVWWFVYNQETEVQTTPIVTENNAQETEDVTIEPEFDATAIQSQVDNWVNSTSGTSSVVVADIDGNVLAAHNADQVYFAASLYKLFVAYEGYKQIDADESLASQEYLNGFTRQECLDKMIRESDSPCGEKMLAEFGQLELTNILRQYGITNTSMTNIATTARDSMVLLSLVATAEGLSEESQASYLDSLKEQPDLYRRGLPSGFSDNVVVYNKVGWNELVEWHDVAIIETPDNKKLIIAVLTENVGSSKISELAGLIEASI